MLKNTLLCLDSQNKERRRQETHYYASEVGILAVPARFKANFGLFQPFQSPADMTRFWPNQPGLARIEAESARIREKKKKKTQTRHRRTGNHVGLRCGTLPAASMLSRSYHCWSPERTIQRPHTQWTFFITFQRGRRKNAKLQIVFISILTKHH